MALGDERRKPSQSGRRFGISLVVDTHGSDMPNRQRTESDGSLSVRTLRSLSLRIPSMYVCDLLTRARALPFERVSTIMLLCSAVHWTKLHVPAPHNARGKLSPSACGLIYQQQNPLLPLQYTRAIMCPSHCSLHRFDHVAKCRWRQARQRRTIAFCAGGRSSKPCGVGEVVGNKSH
jgi:hypothetical protein